MAAIGKLLEGLHLNGGAAEAGSGKAQAEAESAASTASTSRAGDVEVRYVVYEDERQLGPIMALVDRDLSEPYSIFTYRYFLNNWPDLCFVALVGDELVGTVVGKAEVENEVNRGYIAMLAVETSFRRLSIGHTLVSKAVERMVERGCQEVFLETEVTNKAALRLYEKLGFAREERLLKYYLNGQDAFRLKLWLCPPNVEIEYDEEDEEEDGCCSHACGGEDDGHHHHHGHDHHHHGHHDHHHQHHGHQHHQHHGHQHHHHQHHDHAGPCGHDHGHHAHPHQHHQHQQPNGKPRATMAKKEAEEGGGGCGGGCHGCGSDATGGSAARGARVGPPPPPPPPHRQEKKM